MTRNDHLTLQETNSLLIGLVDLKDITHFNLLVAREYSPTQMFVISINENTGDVFVRLAGASEATIPIRAFKKTDRRVAELA